MQKCEKLLNFLFLRDYPRIHHEDFNPLENIEKLDQCYKHYPNKITGLFDVANIIDDSIVLTEFETRYTYCIQGLPVELVQPGMIFNGTMVKQNDDLYWHWYVTSGIYPQRGKQYISYAPDN